jgi:hypothetical protein
VLNYGNEAILRKEPHSLFPLTLLLPFLRIILKSSEGLALMVE